MIENYFSEYYNSWLFSVPFYVYDNKRIIKIDTTNFNYYFKRKNYFIYHNYNFSYDIIPHVDNYKHSYPKLSKLIFYISDFYNDGYVIWGVVKDSKLEEFYESYINDYSEINIKKAMKEISEIYSKFNLFLTSKYEDLKNASVKYSDSIDKINDLIAFICSDNIDINTKYNLLNELIKYFAIDEILKKEVEKLKTEKDLNKHPVIYHNIIFKIGNILKKRKKEMKNFENNYLNYFAYCLNLEFIEKFKKQYNEVEFENKIKNIMAMKDKDDEEEILKYSSSKIWQFNEFSKDPPIKLKEIPNTKKKVEEIENEEISEKLKINEEILNNNKIEIEKVNTINEIIELFKKSSLLTQLFPFLIGKINKDEINKIFNNLYSIYISYKKYDKSILSEDSIKYCNLFEKI